MADEVDIASEQADEMTERSIAAIRNQVNSGESAYFCIDCDEEIPELRREKVQGCKRCADCQSQYESKSRHYRH